MGNAASVSVKTVVIVESGYTGSQLAKAPDSKFNVVLINPTSHTLHKIATLRGVVVPNWEKRSFVPLDKLLKKGKLIQGNVQNVQEGQITTKDGIKIQGDCIVICTGGGEMSFPAGPMEDAQDVKSLMVKMKEKQVAIKNAKNILIIGGGPVGVELAGEIGAQYKDKKITSVHSGKTLLNNSVLPIVDGMLVENLPESKNFDSFIHGDHVFNLSTGESICADLTVLCVGSIRRGDNLVSAVNEKNQVQGMNQVFCIGDANDLKETKLAYLGAKQADLTAANLVLLSKNQALKSYTPMDGQKTNGSMSL